MLKNQDAEQPLQTSSGQTPSGAPRVTSDELNAALAAIEARKQAEASRLAGTIPLDQAVADLHLDSSPDEIWAEVQGQRAKADAAQEAKKRKSEQQGAKPQKRTRPFQVTPAPLIGLQAGKPGVRPRGWRRLLAPVLVIGVLMGTGVIPHSFTPHGFSPSLLTTGHSPAAPILKPLSAFPDGKEVHADNTALAQISSGVPTSKVFVCENADDNRWKLIKLQGHVYLEGYIARTDALQSLQGKAFNVYNDDDSGDLERVHTSDIRLRVDKTPLLKAGGDSDYSEVTVPNFQPDPLTTLSEGR